MRIEQPFSLGSSIDCIARLAHWQIAMANWQIDRLPRPRFEIQVKRRTVGPLIADYCNNGQLADWQIGRLARPRFEI